MFSSPRRVFLFLILLTGLHLAYIGRVELTPDEAYYQMWSERLDWGYYSKGPGVAAAIRAGTALFGTTEFGVRCLSPLLALGTSLRFVRIHTPSVWPANAAGWATFMLNVIPIFQAGSLLMTIDPLSIFFWSAAMVDVLARTGKAAGVRLPYWMLTGLFASGLGFLCKYTNAMELAVRRALAMSGGRRAGGGSFGAPGFYVMRCSWRSPMGSPPVFWNANHAWITLNHLHDRGKLGTAYEQAVDGVYQFSRRARRSVLAARVHRRAALPSAGGGGGRGLKLAAATAASKGRLSRAPRRLWSRTRKKRVSCSPSGCRCWRCTPLLSFKDRR